MAARNNWLSRRCRISVGTRESRRFPRLHVCAACYVNGTKQKAHMTYKIIGGDGQQYGPAEAAQLREWIAAGRANAQTLAQAEGSLEWKPLGSYADFADLS